MKGRIEIPPAQLLTMLFILGQWFGFLGVLIAAPLLAVLRTIYLAVYVPAINSNAEAADELTKLDAPGPSR